MATIQKVRRQVIANTVDAGAIGRAQQGFQQGAQALTQLAQRQEQLEIASAKSEVAKANAEANRAFNATLSNNQLQYSSNPTGGIEEWNVNMDNEQQAIRSSLTTDRAKSMFDQTSRDLRDRYTVKHDAWQQTQTASNVLKNISDTGDIYNNDAFSAGKSGDIEQFASTVSNYQDVIVAGSGAVAPDKLGELSTAGIKGLTENFVLGAISETPETAIDLLDSGRFDEVFTPGERLDFEEKAYKEIERQEKVSLEEGEELQDANYFEAMVSIQTNVNAPSVDSIVASVGSGDISESDGEKLIKALTEESSQSTNVDVYSEMNIKLADGTLTQREIADAVSNNDITSAQATKFVDFMTTKVSANPAFKRAQLELESVYPKGGFLGRSEEDERLFAEGLANLQDAVREGKNLMEVVKEIKEGSVTSRKESNSNAIKEQVANAIGDSPTPDRIDEELQRAIDGLQRAHDASTQALFRAKIKALDEQRKRLGY